MGMISKRKFYIRCRPLSLLALLCCLAQPALTGDHILYHEALRPLDPLGAQSQASETVSPLKQLRFDAFGRRFDFELQSHAAFNRHRSSQSYRLMRGTIRAIPGSWIRLMQSGEELSGLFFDGLDWYAIEPRDSTAIQLLHPGAANETVNVVYRLADVLITDRQLRDHVKPITGSADADIDGKDSVTAKDAVTSLIAELQSPLKLMAASATRRITVGIIGDYEFYQAFGDDSEAQLLARMNIVDGIFSDQLNLAITVADITVFTTADDPFESTNASSLLDELSSYRQSNQTQFGLTHLLTYRNLDTNTSGIAWLGGACRSRFGAALSQQLGTNLTLGALTVAHEIGHNLDAPHDAEAAGPGEPANPCESTPLGFLMAPTISSSNTFSQCSLSEMENFLASPTAACVTAVAADGVELANVPANTQARPDTDSLLAFDIINPGIAEISDVTLQVDFELPLTLSDAPASCVAGNSPQLVCNFGNLAGGQSLPVSLTFISSELGSNTVTLMLSNSENNQVSNQSVTVTISEPVAVSSGGGGGGGSLSGLAIFALLLVPGWRRQISRSKCG